MKKIFNIMLCFMIIVVIVSCYLCGCKQKNAVEVATPIFDNGKYIQATFPADLAVGLSYNEKTEQEIKDEWISKGAVVEKVSKEEDGTVIVKLEKKDIDNIKKNIKKSFNDGVQELKELSHAGVLIFPHIVSMRVSDDFQKCTVEYTLNAEEQNDSTLATYYFKNAARYNALDGDAFKEVSCDFINDQSKTLIHSISSKTLWGR